MARIVGGRRVGCVSPNLQSLWMEDNEVVVADTIRKMEDSNKVNFERKDGVVDASDLNEVALKNKDDVVSVPVLNEDDEFWGG